MTAEVIIVDDVVLKAMQDLFGPDITWETIADDGVDTVDRSGVIEVPGMLVNI